MEEFIDTLDPEGAERLLEADNLQPRLEQLDLVGVDIAGDHLALVIHVDGGGEGLAPRRGAIR